MDRREFVRTGMKAGAMAGKRRAYSVPAGPPPTYGSAGILDAGVWEQQEMMQAGKLTSHSLTSQYLARIKTTGMVGAGVPAGIEINPEALRIALDMDRERALKRVRGPLHGIPILLRDNIATGDRMRTSAVWPELAVGRAARDAHVVAQLRAAGAVILGKTYQGEGKPAGADRAAAGELLVPLTGSGVAIAAGLATLAVETASDGSIVSPASLCGLVGIRPTLGLVGRSGIVSTTRLPDSAGPMARSVADAALMLSAMAGADPDDPDTHGGAGKVEDYRAALNKTGLKDARIGVARGMFGRDAELDAVMEKALLDLRTQGAVLVDTEVFCGHGSGDDETIGQLIKAHGLDALVAPTAGVARQSAGPHITVPAGQAQGLPVGLSFVGAAYSDARLIGMAYSFEQATLHRRMPQFAGVALLPAA